MEPLRRTVVLTAFIFGVALLRLVPHPPNLVPMTAICLFAGAQFRSRGYRLAVPLLAISMTDAFQGTGNTPIAVFAYASYVLSIQVGHFMLSSNRLLTLLPASLCGSILFYVLSNLGFWLCTEIYAPSLAGLTDCYLRALPYLRSSMIADAFYVMAMFVVFTALEKTCELTEPWCQSRQRKSSELRA